MKTKPIIVTPELADSFVKHLTQGELSDDGVTYHLLFRGVNDYVRFNKCQAHRFAYTLWVSSIPDGLVIDHRPDCPKNCVQPMHLQAMTQAEHLSLTRSRGEMRLPLVHTKEMHVKTNLANCKLTALEVKYAQGLRDLGYTYAAIGAELSVAGMTISRILNGKIKTYEEILCL